MCHVVGPVLALERKLDFARRFRARDPEFAGHLQGKEVL